MNILRSILPESSQCVIVCSITITRTLLRGLNSNMKAEVLMACPRDVPTTINRMRHIYYCNTMKMEDRTTSEETTTGATLQRIGDLTTKLREIVHVRERIEDESRVYLGSDLKATGIHCQNYHDNYDYPVCPPGYRQYQRFHRDANSYRSCVPDRGVSNINTPSPLSTTFGVYIDVFFWPVGIPWENADSYFIINDEHWTFSVI